MRNLAVSLSILLLAACSTPARRDASAPGPSSPSSAPQAAAATGSSRYYKDDGPGANPPADLDAVPDAVPRAEPLHRFANRPYTVLGRDYVPATALRSYRERGIASWYGRKFHGEKTSIGETYDMYGMTAAHPTLPLPSYARVTNVATGRFVIVRVNDRGPFLHDRVIDLSYAAAHKLGIAQRGSGEVEVEAIVPGAPGMAVAAVASAAAGQRAVSPVVQAEPVLGSNAAPARPAAVVTNPIVGLPVIAGRSDLAVAAEAPLVAPVSRAEGGYSVQLGAFSSYPNAQNFLAHVQNQLASAQVEAKVRESGGLYRVYVGPYPARDDARRAGERITQAFGFATSVAPH